MVDGCGLGRLRAGLRRLLAGTVCRSCGAATEAGRLCATCRADLPWNESACPHCALPVPVADTPCGACAAAPLFRQATVPLLLRPPVHDWVHRLKYHAAFADMELLAELFTERLARTRSTPLPELIVPVPLHASRLRARGFNQALELARLLARRLSLQVAPEVVTRVRATPDQIGLDAAQRRRNLRGAFRCASFRAAGRVAIFDDVLTTGSTLAELERTLRAAGASTIEVWAIARTPRAGAGPRR